MGQKPIGVLAHFPTGARRADARTHVNRGYANLALGRFEDAVADFDNAARRSGETAEVSVGRGYAKVGLGEYDLALEEFEAAIGRAPDYVMAYVGRGLAKEGRGDTKGARLDYASAWELAKTAGDERRVSQVSGYLRNTRR